MPIDHDKTASGPAISLDKFQEAAPALVDLYKTARVSLDKHRLTGQRAAVYLVIDHSGSMRPYFRDGSVQGLAEQVLALAAHFDDDGSVPVVFFDTVAHRPVEVPVRDHAGAVERIRAGLGPMGRTDYAAAMAAVIAHYQASGSRAPAFVVFQTDGSPTSRGTATRTLCDAARLPIFWQFIGFGDDEFTFLRRLDDLPVPGKRIVDNAGFFAAGSEPRSIPAGALYDQLMGEFPQWLVSARAAGVLPPA
ncbi:VWA domain-containing protein [Polymorphospora rubra]|uniref:VWA domain-containing protein n=1 Tax=Polymorphospora rubra TaxID=338584 RepID=UPI0033EA4777